MQALFSDYIENLTFQQRRILREAEQDLVLWQYPSLESLWPLEDLSAPKRDVSKAYDEVMGKVTAWRNSPIDFSTFNPDYDFKGKGVAMSEEFASDVKIMGKCPCPRDGELTRCCNLHTLDAVQQCAFACSYCSIQSFYSENKVRVVADLSRHLEKMSLENDVWHIGTGQSSDSLLLGDDFGTLSALFAFARKHPDIVIELKTKSARRDWMDMDIPRNVVSTWSVNAQTASAKEEHLASSPLQRIKAAAECASKGHLVGFHVHPMMWFNGWEQEYADVVRAICDSVDPSTAVMVGIGTLTFTKQNLRTLRESGRPTRVTQMSLTPAAGKFSYSLDVKKKLFSTLFGMFPQDWRDNVFFYLCMEDPSLWEPCLGRSYSCNADFEEDMKRHYLSKTLHKPVCSC